MHFDAMGVRIPAEVRGEIAQGKPRLRKHAPWDRRKLHLPQLVMAVACLPEPRREDRGQAVALPLENKEFLIDQMEFEVVEEMIDKVVLSPLKVSILHSRLELDMQLLLGAMARDWEDLDDLMQRFPQLAEALATHAEVVRLGVNTTDIRTAADEAIRVKSERFGPSNAGSARALLAVEAMPPVSAEDVTGTEGRLLVRLHRYKERDRHFSRRVRERCKSQGDGLLTCQACGATPSATYGDAGDRAMEAHHRVPIEELQPDSEVRIEDMAMLCANCHRVVHSRKPCYTVEELQELLQQHQ